MKFAIVVNGTRGDVQPMVALASRLMQKGHEIIFCAPPENEEIIKRHNCPYVPFGPNYREIFKNKPDMKGGATVGPSPKKGKEETLKQIDLLPEIIKGSDMVLGVGFVLGVPTVAELLKIPYRFFIYYPVMLGTSKSDPLFNKMMFGFGKRVINIIMNGFLNKKRATLGLPPIRDLWAHWLGDRVIVACDKEINEVKEGVSYNYTQTGFMLPPPQTTLPENIKSFIDSGNPPVFIGFGSNPVAEPEKISKIFVEVAKATGQRLIISKGWASLPENNSMDILFVDEIPYELLFPRLAAIVYHGGTGTMAIAARAGIPQAAFPFMADQFENRKRIVALGLGPHTCDFKKLSATAVIKAITACTTNMPYKINAQQIAQKLQQTDGTKETITLIEKEFLA